MVSINGGEVRLPCKVSPQKLIGRYSIISHNAPIPNRQQDYHDHGRRERHLRLPVTYIV